MMQQYDYWLLLLWIYYYYYWFFYYYLWNIILIAIAFYSHHLQSDWPVPRNILEMKELKECI